MLITQKTYIHQEETSYYHSGNKYNSEVLNSNRRLEFFVLLKIVLLWAGFILRGNYPICCSLKENIWKAFACRAIIFTFLIFRSWLYETLSLKSYSAILLSKYFHFFFQWIEINTFHYKSIHFLIYKTAKIREED